MMSTYLPSLDPPTVRREKVRKRVRQTSVAAYADGRDRFTGRKADVLRWLARYINKFQNPPTSAELAADHGDGYYHGGHVMGHTLYVRRGLSDLQTAGVVETVPKGKRRCRVSGKTCECWRVIPLGRTKE